MPQSAAPVSVLRAPQVFGSQVPVNFEAVPHAIVSGSGSSPARNSGPLNSPTVIAAVEQSAFGRYTLLEKLGEGGMCEIYTAALVGPEGFQRTFVIKRLKPELAGNRAAVDQFIDEANLGSTLVHSNIVPVFDFGKAGDAFFIAQEYIVGRNVSEILARHHERLGEPLDLTTVFYIAHETLKGLAYAHRKTTDEGVPLRLVHRDVSPNNIMVSVLGEVKLLDFGIVKAEGRISHTDLGNVKGNASYMAPEQARGLAVDARSDLFTLGLVMFNALTNESFYAGGTGAEVFYQAARGPTAEHEARISRLPSPAAEILGRALAADPAKRYQTADDFAGELVSHLPAGTGNNVAALLHALFGPDLRPQSGGSDRIRTTGIRGRRAG